mmetsp:Transcript_11277/g.26528  ORF Transcript_11277/g.26528 Transcript_11277/m.26528 type:complete len:258 (+) Transcript_11277:261-1034(+)
MATWISWGAAGGYNSRHTNGPPLKPAQGGNHRFLGPGIGGGVGGGDIGCPSSSRNTTESESLGTFAGQHVQQEQHEQVGSGQQHAWGKHEQQGPQTSRQGRQHTDDFSKRISFLFHWGTKSSPNTTFCLEPSEHEQPQRVLPSSLKESVSLSGQKNGTIIMVSLPRGTSKCRCISVLASRRQSTCLQNFRLQDKPVASLTTTYKMPRFALGFGAGSGGGGGGPSCFSQVHSSCNTSSPALLLCSSSPPLSPSTSSLT